MMYCPRILNPLTREDCGGTLLRAGQKAVIARARDGVLRLKYAHPEVILSLIRRGLAEGPVDSARLTDKGVFVRRKLTALVPL